MVYVHGAGGSILGLVDAVEKSGTDIFEGVEVAIFYISNN